MNATGGPRPAISDDEILRCFEVMAELRPQLRREDFLPTVRQMQREGYQLACLEEHGNVVAVAGYRISHSFFLGRSLFIDDLVTAAATRGRSHGARLLDWLRDQARAAGCTVVHLESGTQRERAHKFYFTQGFTINAFHFQQRLDDA